MKRRSTRHTNSGSVLIVAIRLLHSKSLKDLPGISDPIRTLRRFLRAGFKTK